MTDGWLEKICPSLRICWRGSWGAGTVEPERFLHDHELVLVTEGSCDMEMAGKHFTLKAGDYVIIPPNHSHSTVCRRSVFRSCIHFDWLPRPGPTRKLMWSYAPQRPAAKDIVATPRFIPKAAYQGTFCMKGPVPGLVETVFFRWQSGTPLGATTARAALLELMAHLFLPAVNRDEAHGQQLRFQLARTVKGLLDANIRSELGIQELLQTLGFSYAHLCRVFHSAFGLTPLEYRNTSRIEQAKILLRDTNLTVAEIAYRVGFQDAGYFAKIFRRTNNRGPKESRANDQRMFEPENFRRQ